METKKIFSENFILAALPALAYAMAFAYEVGISSYYGIPVDFISISATQICLALVTIMTFGLVIMLITNASFELLPCINKNIKFQRRLKTLFKLVVFIIILFFIVEYNLKYSEQISAVLLVLFLFEFVFKDRDKTKKGNYRKNLEAQEELDKINNTYTDLTAGGFIKFNSKFVMYFIFIVLVSHLSGEITAAKKSTYLTYNGNGDTFLLRVYGDTYVFGHFDKVAFAIDGISLTKLSDAVTTNLTPKTVGTLNRTVVKK